MVYTSYFTKASKLNPNDYIFISIAQVTPSWFNHECLTYFPLQPNVKNLNLFKNGSMTQSEFAEKYEIQILDELDPKEVWEDLYSLEKDVLILCWEKLDNPKKFCHRTLVRNWLHKNLGLTVDELE